MDDELSLQESRAVDFHFVVSHLAEQPNGVVSNPLLCSITR